MVKVLRGKAIGVGELGKVCEAVAVLNITMDQWKHELLSSIHIPLLGCSSMMGIRLSYISKFGCCCITDILTDSPTNIHVRADSLLHWFILEVDRVRVRMVDKINHELMLHNCLPQCLLGVTLLLGTLSDDKNIPDSLEFTPMDDGVL